MAAKLRPAKREPQEPIKHADPNAQLPDFNVALVAEKALTWQGLTKDSLRALSPEDFLVRIREIWGQCYLLCYSPTWRLTWDTPENALDYTGMHEFPRGTTRAQAERFFDDYAEHIRTGSAPLPTDPTEREMAKELGPFTPARIEAAWPVIEKQLREWYESDSPVTTPPDHAIQPPGSTTHGATVAEDDDRIITKQGKRYYPISLAAERAQVPRTTLVDWMKAKARFQGSPLDIYNSPTARKLFLSEESVQRLANRFVKWPSQEPTGPVTLGHAPNKTGYIGIAKAARAIGVDHHTMWLWTTQGKAPVDKPLDVIKCTGSEQFYISETELPQLKKHVPRSGLKRGRRPSPTPR